MPETTMHEWMDANPCLFHPGEGEVGDVYCAMQQGPPLRVRRVDDWEATAVSDIVIEVEDCMVAARNQIRREHANTAMRLAFSKKHARHLCHSLIHALADSGDRVAYRLRDRISDIIEEVRREDEADD